MTNIRRCVFVLCFFSLLCIFTAPWIDVYEARIEREREGVVAYIYLRVYGEEPTVIEIPLLFQNSTVIVLDGEGKEVPFLIANESLLIPLDEADGEEYYLAEIVEEEYSPTIRVTFKSLMDVSVATISLCGSKNFSLLDYTKGAMVEIREESLCATYFYTAIDGGEQRHLFATFGTKATSDEGKIILPQPKKESKTVPRENETENWWQAQKNLLVGIVVLLFLIGIAVVILHGRKRRVPPSQQQEMSKEEPKETKEKTHETSMASLPQQSIKYLPEKEQKIIEALVKEGGSSTGVKLKAITGLSHASLSRALKSLSSKGLIAVERYGMTNLVILKKEE